MPPKCRVNKPRCGLQVKSANEKWYRPRDLDNVPLSCTKDKAKCESNKGSEKSRTKPKTSTKPKTKTSTKPKVKKTTKGKTNRKVSLHKKPTKQDLQNFRRRLDPISDKGVLPNEVQKIIKTLMQMIDDLLSHETERYAKSWSRLRKEVDDLKETNENYPTGILDDIVLQMRRQEIPPQAMIMELVNELWKASEQDNKNPFRDDVKSIPELLRRLREANGYPDEVQDVVNTIIALLEAYQKHDLDKYDDQLINLRKNVARVRTNKDISDLDQEHLRLLHN